MHVCGGLNFVIEEGREYEKRERGGEEGKEGTDRKEERESEKGRERDQNTFFSSMHG